jgi:hypothetical protein
MSPREGSGRGAVLHAGDCRESEISGRLDAHLEDEKCCILEIVEESEVQGRLDAHLEVTQAHHLIPTLARKNHVGRAASECQYHSFALRSILISKIHMIQKRRSEAH